jgi:hypothetical protein
MRAGIFLGVLLSFPLTFVVVALLCWALVNTVDLQYTEDISPHVLGCLMTALVIRGRLMFVIATILALTAFFLGPKAGQLHAPPQCDSPRRSRGAVLYSHGALSSVLVGEGPRSSRDTT